MRVGFLVFLCYFFPLHAKEFLYPVGYYPERDTVFVIYQKTSTHLELWEWDLRTEYAHQLLLSRYSPAGFTFLPDYSGFSFIDNGMLKVKQLLKRSPRTIEYDAPIYNVEQVNWIDSKICYTSGKYQDYFGIFQIDWDGLVQPILFQEGVDYQYPQKIDQFLFFIERTEDGCYRIACTNYFANYQEEEFSSRIDSYLKSKPFIREILHFDKKPLAFLRMVSAYEGFVLSHSKVVSKNDPSVSFDYYHFTQDNGLWNLSLLFSFTVPTQFLVMGYDRLYESMLPLLPNVCQRGIYYVDSSATSFLALYFFEFVTEKKRLVARANQHLFGVRSCQKGVVYGGEIKGLVEMTEGVWMKLGLEE